MGNCTSWFLFISMTFHCEISVLWNLAVCSSMLQGVFSRLTTQLVNIITEHSITMKEHKFQLMWTALLPTLNRFFCQYFGGQKSNLFNNPLEVVHLNIHSSYSTSYLQSFKGDHTPLHRWGNTFSVYLSRSGAKPIVKSSSHSNQEDHSSAIHIFTALYQEVCNFKEKGGKNPFKRTFAYLTLSLQNSRLLFFLLIFYSSQALFHTAPAEMQTLLAK